MLRHITSIDSSLVNFDLWTYLLYRCYNILGALVPQLAGIEGVFIVPKELKILSTQHLQAEHQWNLARYRWCSRCPTYYGCNAAWLAILPLCHGYLWCYRDLNVLNWCPRCPRYPWWHRCWFSWVSMVPKAIKGVLGALDTVNVEPDSVLGTLAIGVWVGGILVF